MSVAQAKVPAVVASSLIFLILGAAGGSLATHIYGDPWEWKKPNVAANTEGAPAEGRPRMGPGGGGPGGGPGGGGMPGRGGPGGFGGGPGGPGGGPGGGRGGRGPNSPAQLANLVAKLDLLTAKPLAVTLTPEQKKKAEEILKDLDKSELSEDDAKKRLDELHALLTPEQQAVLEETGYRWPGQRGGGPGGGQRPPEGNPFKEGENAKHLKELRARLGA